MNKLLIFALMTLGLQANQKNLVIGAYTQHVNYQDEFRSEYKFQEDNNLIGFEIINGKNSYSIVSFENSYFNQSYGVNYHRLFKTENKLSYSLGLSLVYGYNKQDTLYSEDNYYRYDFNNPFYLGNKMSLIPTVGIDYKLSKNVNLDVELFGQAVVCSFKVELM